MPRRRNSRSSIARKGLSTAEASRVAKRLVADPAACARYAGARGTRAQSRRTGLALGRRDCIAAVVRPGRRRAVAAFRVSLGSRQRCRWPPALTAAGDVRRRRRAVAVHRPPCAGIGTAHAASSARSRQRSLRFGDCSAWRRIASAVSARQRQRIRVSAHADARVRAVRRGGLRASHAPIRDRQRPSSSAYEGSCAAGGDAASTRHAARRTRQVAAAAPSVDLRGLDRSRRGQPRVGRQRRHPLG